MKKVQNILRVIITAALSIFLLSSLILPYFSYYSRADDFNYIWSLRAEIFVYSEKVDFFVMTMIAAMLFSVIAVVCLWLPRKAEGFRAPKSIAKIALISVIIINFSSFCVWFAFDVAADIRLQFGAWLSIACGLAALLASIALSITCRSKNVIPVSRKNEKFSVYDAVVVVIISIVALVMAYPFYNALIISLMGQSEYMFDRFAFWPANPTLDSYVSVLFDESNWLATGYKNTAVIVLFTVVYSLVVTTPCSYALSKRKFPGKMIFLNYIIFTMFFTGGVVPYYMLIKQMNLIGSLWSLILPAGFTPFYMLLMRNFFMGIPNSIEESARLDGAGDWRILISIILPLSKPVIASVALFKAVDVWNEWFYSMLFLGRDPVLFPLQYALRSRLLVATTVNRPGGGGVYIESVKMAAVVVAMLPIMLLYPLIQKYFVTGIMTGAVKE